MTTIFNLLKQTPHKPITLIVTSLMVISMILSLAEIRHQQQVSSSAKEANLFSNSDSKSQDLSKPVTLNNDSTSDWCSLNGPYPREYSPNIVEQENRFFLPNHQTYEVSPELISDLNAFIDRVYRDYGDKIWVAFGYRTYDEQLQMCQECQAKNFQGCMVAPAAQSNHRSGYALDLYLVTYGAMQAMTPYISLAAEYNFDHPISSDTPHFEWVGATRDDSFERRYTKEMVQQIIYPDSRDLSTQTKSISLRTSNDIDYCITTATNTTIPGNPSCSAYGGLGCGDICQTACDCGDPATSGGTWQCKDIGFDGQTRCWNDNVCGGESDRIRIKGTVKACDGDPIPGVSVSAMGNTVSTDDQGKWELSKAFITWSPEQQKQIENYRTIEIRVGSDAQGSGFFTTVQNPQFIRGGTCGNSDTNINCNWQGSYHQFGGPVRKSYRVDASKIRSEGEKRLYRQYYTSQQEPDGETFNSFDFIPAECNHRPDAKIIQNDVPISVGKRVTWTIQATDTDGNLVSSGTWIKNVLSNSWTRLRWIGNQNTSTINYTASWTCPTAGTYEITVNAKDDRGLMCSGNPTQSGVTRCASGQDKKSFECIASTPTPSNSHTIKVRVYGRRNSTTTALPQIRVAQRNNKDQWIPLKLIQNNQIINKTIIDVPIDRWKILEFSALSNRVNPDDIRVHFVNDSGTDLRVDWMEMNGKRYQSESPNTYSKGSYSKDTKCAAGYKQSEWLHCVGYFQY